MDITCIILAGGKAVRLGQDKLRQVVGRRSLLEEVLYRTRAMCKDTIVVTRQDGTLPPTNGSSHYRVVRDVVQGKGPMGGIYSGVAASDTFFNFVVAGDMPFLNEKLMKYMIDAVDNFDLVIPDVDGLVEPLHAIYSKNCLAPIKYLMNQDKLGVHQLIPLVKVRQITTEEIDQFDPEHWSFFNINTAADLEKARDRAEKVSLND